MTRIVPGGHPSAVRGLVRALIVQIAVLHSPADVRISVCASADRLRYWEWVKWLPHNQHPTERDAAGPVRLMSPSLGGLEPMLGLRDRARFSAGAKDAGEPEALPLHVIVADGAAREPGVDLDGLEGVVIIEVGGTTEACGSAEVGGIGVSGTCGSRGVGENGVNGTRAYRLGAGGVEANGTDESEANGAGGPRVVRTSARRGGPPEPGAPSGGGLRK